MYIMYIPNAKLDVFVIEDFGALRSIPFNSNVLLIYLLYYTKCTMHIELSGFINKTLSSLCLRREPAWYKQNIHNLLEYIA